MPEKIDRQETAYHEAGHVVADFVQGFYVFGASIRPDEWREGCSEGEGPWADGSRDREAIVSLYAGLAAARLVRPGRGVEDGGASNDYERAAELLPTVSESREELEASAAALVAQNRALVEAVAELLLAEEAVCGDDLEMVCAAVQENIDWRKELAELRRLRPT